jgi:hypothetical protein
VDAQGCQDAAVDSENLGRAPVASAFLPRSWWR